MCYQIPGNITRNGRPILGGTDIDASDAAFAGLIYPKPKTTAPPRRNNLGDAVKDVVSKVRKAVGRTPTNGSAKTRAKTSAKKATAPAKRSAGKAGRSSAAAKQSQARH